MQSYLYPQRHQPLPAVVYVFIPLLPHRAGHDGPFPDVVGAWVSWWPMLLAVSQLPGVCEGLWVAAVSLPVT